MSRSWTRASNTPVTLAVALAVVLVGDLLAVRAQGDDKTEPVRVPAAAQVEASPLTLPADPTAPAAAAPTASAPVQKAPPAKAAPAGYGPVTMPSCPVVPPGNTVPKTKVPAVAEAAVPAPVPAPAPAADLAALRGRSVWITNWRDSDVDVDALVARSKRAGLSAVWVRTGGSRQGYYGDAILTRLVPAAHAAGLKVIAWDFPFLSDPLKDVERARQALEFRVAGQGIDAFSPDIETSAEGTFVTPRRVASYLSRVRVLAGDRVVVATVPRPTDKNVARFPYAAHAPYVDAFAPMVYWSCREPGAVAIQAVERLSGMRPVHVVGQGYDMANEGGRRGLPTAVETLRFLDASRRAGAVGGSLWTVEKFGPGQWGPLSSYAWS